MHRFGKDVLLARAAQIDAGFDAKVLAGRTANVLLNLAIRTSNLSRNSRQSADGAAQAPLNIASPQVKALVLWISEVGRVGLEPTTGGL